MPAVSRRTLLAGSGLAPLRPSWAQASGRIALVVGNAGYRSIQPLNNPRRDARGMAALLSRLDFRVELLLDATRNDLLAALARFRQAASAEAALLHYSGHALQLDGVNWLVPVDAVLHPAAPTAPLVGLAECVSAMGRATSRILLLDACRNDPFEQGRDRRPAGLARVNDADHGVLIGFATAPGSVALDGRGLTSPFTDAMLEHIGTPGLEIRQVLTRVRRMVLEATDGQQIPWDTSSLTRDVILRTPGHAPVPRPNRTELEPAPAPVPAAVPSPRPQSAPPRPAVQAAPAPSALAPAGRFREIPNAYAYARAARIPLPSGIAVRQYPEGDPRAALVGSWHSGGGQQVVVVVSVNEQLTRVVILAAHTSTPYDHMPGWWRRSATLNGSKVDLSSAFNVSEFDLASGWSLTAGTNTRGRAFTNSFRRIRLD
ncbi:caspase family protein [Roseococcus sp. SYP-B2431]|uniref:caspase family protein n=1 Tax=Roseococcus sp. SYP-B2431 TaxID=2496640 RepID=UPI0013F4A0B8|nr:caspase family protein [Roseococcus sp. SYP-B2431]